MYSPGSSQRGMLDQLQEIEAGSHYVQLAHQKNTQDLERTERELTGLQQPIISYTDIMEKRATELVKANEKKQSTAFDDFQQEIEQLQRHKSMITQKLEKLEEQFCKSNVKLNAMVGEIFGTDEDGGEEKLTFEQCEEFANQRDWNIPIELLMKKFQELDVKNEGTLPLSVWFQAKSDFVEMTEA